MIDRVGHRGDGVTDGAQEGSGSIYVPGTLPGETVEVENWPGHPDRRLLLKVETPSADRIAPICPHFGVCGGCAVQHWQSENYRAWKRDLVVTALRQAGIEAPVADLIDAHGAAAAVAAPCSTPGAVAMTFSKSAFPPRAPTT